MKSTLAGFSWDGEALAAKMDEARALETKQSSLSRMREGARLDSRVTITEATAEGVAPGFQGHGFVRPQRVALVERGALVGALVSPRTAREFLLSANGANGDESPEPLAIAGGTLDARDALSALDARLFVGNLHYLN